MRLTAYADVESYPALREHGVVPAPAVLDRMAQDFANSPRITAYGRRVAGLPSMEDFLLLDLPRWLYEFPSGAAPSYGLDLARPADFGRYLWLAHVSGYFGGLWLRTNFQEYDSKTRASVPFTNGGIGDYYRDYVDRLGQLSTSGSPADVLTAVRGTLRSSQPVPPTADFTAMTAYVLPPNDNVGSFAYDAAWLEAILPPNPDSPKNARPQVKSLFSVNVDRLLDTRFGIAELRMLESARKRLGPVVDASGQVAARYRDAVDGGVGEMSLVDEQRRYYRNGHNNYTVGPPGLTNYRGFPQDQYDRVLTWAAYAVMFNQAASTQALTSYALADAENGRVVLQETVGWAAYAGAYLWGHFNPAYDGSKTMAQVLPAFARAC